MYIFGTARVYSNIDDFQDSLKDYMYKQERGELLTQKLGKYKECMLKPVSVLQFLICNVVLNGHSSH